MTKITRQQRRAQARKELKEKYKSPEHTAEVITPQKQKVDAQVVKYAQYIPQIIKEINQIKSNIKVLDEHLFAMVETLKTKDILNWGDIKRMESLLKEKEEYKELKIKELLQEDYTVEEYLDILEKYETSSEYKRIAINPFKDLNLNPYEIAEAIKQRYPDNTEKDLRQIAKTWKMPLDAFGIKEEKPK